MFSQNSMANSIFFFLLVSLSLISSTTHVESAEEGFISVDIFNKGLDFAKDLLIERAVSSLIPFQLPKIEKNVKIPLVGKVQIVLSNFTLFGIDVSSSTVQPGDTGIVMVVSGATANLSMGWRYSYSTWLFKISDNGDAFVEVEGMEVGLTLGFENQQGSLKLSLLECGCYVKDISIKLDGGASWLYQGIVDAFGGQIASAVEDAVSDKIRDGIGKLDSLLQTLPKEIPLDDIAALNVTFVNDPVLSNSSVNVGINGLFTSKDDIQVFNHYLRDLQASVSCKGPAKMVGASFHENVLNSASLVYYNADFMNWIVYEERYKALLNTARWRYIVPELYKKYPNCEMNLNISVSSPPVVRISQQSMASTVYSDVIVNVLDDDEEIPVVCIAVEISLSASPKISLNNLAGSVEVNDFKMSLKWSKIGKLHIFLVQSTVSTILKTVLLPYVNLRLWRGLPLPMFHGYTLRNAQIFCTDSRIVICSDVASVKHISM